MTAKILSIVKFLHHMTLKQKLEFGFLLTAVIIFILAGFEYLNFVKIKQAIRNLEFTDTIRSKSLQLKRHEKNFFLLTGYDSQHEAKEIYRYLDELRKILNENSQNVSYQYILKFKLAIEKYKETFETVQKDINELSKILNSLLNNRNYKNTTLLVTAMFPEKPLIVSKFLKENHIFSSSDDIILRLEKLHADIQLLRKYGEEIIFISKDLDSVARNRAEKAIFLSEIAILIFFPVFFLISLGFLSFVTGSIVNRLNLLRFVIEKAGKGEFTKLDVGNVSDEIGILIEKFNQMEDELLRREEEIRKKNEELLQSKKLAALGTLAAGVAHELNNPLNNIYVSAQVLKKEAGRISSPTIEEIVNDIMSQAQRVKHIVADLLEFARGREPVLREIDLKEVILGSYKLVSTTRNTDGIRFSLESPVESVIIKADPEQMERVFINLFNNAIDSMKGSGELRVSIEGIEDKVVIKVSDSGEGIPPDILDKIFEPFYSTKERGTGLGLAIVYNIIKRHAGEISVESTVGKGTTFKITLNRLKA